MEQKLENFSFFNKSRGIIYKKKKPKKKTRKIVKYEFEHGFPFMIPTLFINVKCQICSSIILRRI